MRPELTHTSLHRSEGKNPQIIYIASTGSSGSTLLELLLGSFTTVWTIGEIYVLPWEIRKNKRQCGCGQKVTECTFWSPIIDKHKYILQTHKYIAHFRDHYSGGRFFRIREMIDIIFKKNMTRPDELDNFCADNLQLLTAVAQRAENITRDYINYLVDSSKDFYRLFWLSHCSNIDIKVIHIVKDPRGFVYSRIKAQRNFATRTRILLRMSIRYVIENFFIEKICNKLPKENYMFLRYEDLASNPELVLNNMSQWLGLSFQPSIVSSFRSNINHGIAGNIMRSRSEGIFLDERWKYNMSTLSRLIIMIITFFYFVKYGYNERH